MGNSFDEKAASWDDNPQRIELVEKVWSLLKNQLKLSAEKKMLDYGCGTGLLGYKAIEQVHSVTFCDTSGGMLDQVKKKRDYYNHQNVAILHSDFTTDKLPAQTYDLIVSMLVLHHVNEIKLLLNKFNKLLNLKGIFCWIDLDKEDGTFHSDNTGVKHFGFSKSEIEDFFEDAGFKTTYYSTEIFMKRERDNTLRNYPLFITVAEKISNK